MEVPNGQYSLIVSGFKALTEEFASLWAKFESLEQRLANSEEECEALRRSYPEAQIQSLSSTEHRCAELRPDKSSSIHHVLRRWNARGGDSANIQKILEVYAFSDHCRRDVVEDECALDFAEIQRDEEERHRLKEERKRQVQASPHDDRLSLSKSHNELGSRTKRASFNDPLETSRARARSLSPATSAKSGPACPIRFLDQHTPEDVAKYFEDHKHELPRSHEVCVKRFQANAESIRELDEKYGNLVSMIQGLGQKHQPMLPANPETESQAGEGNAKPEAQKIVSWADAVEKQAATEGVIPTEREGHFERPLKEVRVGESPSRPWGVPIPSKYLEAAEPLDVGVDTEAKKEARSQPKTKCPFDPTLFATVKGKGVERKQEGKPEPATRNVESSTRMEVGADEVKTPNETASKGSITVINHNLAFISSIVPEEPGKDMILHNHGTLVFGYSDEKAESLLKRLYNNSSELQSD